MEKLSYDLTEVEESMKDASCILDNSIRNTYQPIPERRGRLLHPTPGRFCIAFPMDAIDGSGARICYRVWKEIIPDAFNRYKYIGDVAKTNLEYFSGFRFVPKALKMKCDGRLVPGIVMDWIEGITLDKFLNGKWVDLTNRARIAFIQDFYYMCYQLRAKGIAHGDLSCLNIMVTPANRIRLVDYDSVYVSSMGNNFYQVTGGAEGFQHPDRINSKNPLLASIDDDNFSQLIIALSLWVAFFEPSITQRYDESNLLFLPGDLSGISSSDRLKNLKNSYGWKIAKKYCTQFAHISTLMSALESIQDSVSQVPSLLKFVSRNTIQSENFYSKLAGVTISKVKYCTACGNIFTNDDFDYCTHCGSKRHVYKTVSL